MVTPTKTDAPRPASGPGPVATPTGVVDLKRMKRPHPYAGTPYRSSCRRASTTGSCTKVRLGATHHVLRALPRVTANTTEGEKTPTPIT